ncbi:TerB family tellurite resistance protein [Chloroflexi bacterium TSY]|nr:TerB family tellurite resistance protein [Chloroflexi bacterium TSY]
MANRNLILSLAKVIIAAAWADHALTNEESNSLKDLLFKLPESYREGGNRRLSAKEWAMLEMYMESPIGPEERAQLITELQEALNTPREKKLALNALNELIHADGVITAEEQAVSDEIRAALDNVNVSIFGQLARLITSPIERRTEELGQAPNRDRHFDDFVRNKVYYGIQRRLDLGEFELLIPDDKLRRLAAIGGLMARVAHIDREVTDSEFDTMVELLQSELSVGHHEALFVAQVAVSEVSPDMDFLQLTREIVTNITPETGAQLLDLLFAVADADGKVTHQESEEIYNIAYNLNLTHKQFIDAKVKIPTERRDS